MSKMRQRIRERGGGSGGRGGVEQCHDTHAENMHDYSFDQGHFCVCVCARVVRQVACIFLGCLRVCECAHVRISSRLFVALTYVSEHTTSETERDNAGFRLLYKFVRIYICV